MKRTSKLFSGIVTVLIVLFLSACEEEKVDPFEDSILPARFKVDIPNSLSNPNGKCASLKNASGDILNGNEIYAHLKNFIAVGEGAADIVEAIIIGIQVHHIERVKQVTYTSEEDNRLKKLVVTEDVAFASQVWQYQLTLTDVLSESNEDGGIGMQVFWNKSPIKGIAIMKPYNINRADDANAGDAIISIEYSEEGMGDYEAYMIIEIAELPTAATDTFAINTLKMFVGKEGDEIDVYGNSNHPNAQFNALDPESKGFNWAFVASGDEVKDIGVAEVGLPPSSLDATSREIILEEYSIKNVLTAEMTNYIIRLYPNANPDDVAEFLAPFLVNTEPPGYFDSEGFIQGGTAPNSEYSELELRIEELIPYNPKEVSELTISFKE